MKGSPLVPACCHAGMHVHHHRLHRPSMAVCFRSWNVTHQYLSGALGFYHLFFATPGQLVSFSLFRDEFNTSVLRFVEFLRQRKVDGRVISKHVLAIEKVLRWLRATAAPAYSAAQEKQHDQQITYTQRLKYQLGMTSNPKPVDPVELRKQGKWLDATELLAVIERTCQACIDLVKVIGLPPAVHMLPCGFTCCACPFAGSSW